MKRKALDLFLLVVMIIGGALAWQTGQERSRLAAEQDRLARITGDLPVADPSKVYVQALETGDPMHFAWRVYYPPKYNQILSDSTGGSTSSSSSSSEFIGRVVFRLGVEGRLYVWTRFSGGSRFTSFGAEALAELLRGRWDKIRIEQIERATIGPNEPATLLRLTLPDELRAEALKKLPSMHDQLPVLFELNLGTKPSKP